jgi:serine palmitoyltransferase
LYVDEAHSIGALGKSGKGVCEHTGVDPADVDILMGTFTKSFGAVGGYIAGSQELIDFMREASAGSAYSPSISPACCQQIISALQVISGQDGTDIGQKKLLAIRENSNYVRQALMDMGCHVLGDWDSPVIPTLLCNPAKIC